MKEGYYSFVEDGTEYELQLEITTDYSGSQRLKIARACEFNHDGDYSKESIELSEYEAIMLYRYLRRTLTQK